MKLFIINDTILITVYDTIYKYILNLFINKKLMRKNNVKL
jgi:hypothetical protein